MLSTIDLNDAYWLVGDHAQSEVFSSSRGAYVPLSDAGYKAFVNVIGAALPIDTEASLIEYLAMRLPDLVISTPLGLQNYANAKQWNLACGGFTATVSNAVKIPFATDPQSQSLITGKSVRFIQPGAPTSTKWQIASGEFITISASDFLLAATQIADFIQSTFDVLQQTIALIASGGIKTKDDVDNQPWPRNS